MNTIEKYIREMLFANGGVILPDLGSIQTKYQEAEIQKDKSGKTKLTPPRKTLFFQDRVVDNDQVLAHYVATKEKISQAEAQKLVTDYVASLKPDLDAGKSVKINGVGELQRDGLNEVHFKTIEENNFLDESYGLSTFYAKSETKKLKVAETPATTAKKGISAGQILLWLLPIAAILIVAFFLLRPYFSEKIYFGKKITQVEVLGNAVEARPLSESALTAANEASFVLYDHATRHYSTKVDVDATPYTKFNLIVGSFQDKKYAGILNRMMRRKSYKSEIMPQTPQAFYRVSLGSYKNVDSAVKSFEKFHKSNKISVWLLFTK